ncbi:siphovirus ReqiPepy6 Gp37-like family protein [Pseudobacillus sp. 179-B 2D1 NHS]|uniref:siphovirus ReqiPepy6 Gp37-like family protein n=1 Tax=Pseudobacillus sp. 179-B 2D1 NHS TaxID=3374292 RepID=UPI003878FDBA
MTNINILNEDLERIGLIDDYESFSFTTNYNKVGEFLLAIEADDNNVRLLEKDQLILVGNNREKVGKIDHTEYDLNEEGKVIKKFSGKTLGTIFEERITLTYGENNEKRAYDQIQGNVETVIRHYINRNIVNAINPARNIPQLEMTTNKMRGEIIRYQSRHKKLKEEVEQLSELYGLGWHIYLDFLKNKWVFDMYEGRNLSVNQSENSPVIFSPKFDNIQGLRYIDSNYTEKNVAYIAADGEGEKRNIYSIGEASGLKRKEVLIEVSASEGKYIDPIEEGKRRLQEHSRINTLDAEINNTDMFQYERDYKLGDIVTVQHDDWRISKDMRITSITEAFEPSGYKLIATFGDKIPSLAERIKQELKIFEPYIRK